MKQSLMVLVITGLLGCTYSVATGQKAETKNKWIKKHPVDFAMGSFSAGIPFSKIFSKDFYPLATLGTEFYYRHKKHSQIYQTLKIGGYYSKYNTSSVFINTEVGYRYTLGLRVYADVNLGIAYSHLFRPNAIYKVKNNKNYEQIPDWGKPSLMANYSLTVGYNFSEHTQRPVSIFVRYANYVQLFYNPDIPVLPQNSFQTGTRFLINKK
jgi:hypothetical protein